MKSFCLLSLAGLAAAAFNASSFTLREVGARNTLVRLLFLKNNV